MFSLKLVCFEIFIGIFSAVSGNLIIHSQQANLSGVETQMQAHFIKLLSTNFLIQQSKYTGNGPRTVSNIAKRSIEQPALCNRISTLNNPTTFSRLLDPHSCLETLSPYRLEDCQNFGNTVSLAIQEWPRAKKLCQRCAIPPVARVHHQVIMQPLSTVVRAWNPTDQVWMKIKVIVAHTCTV